MKILVVTQHYYPEIGAPSKRLTELTKIWANQGNKVVVYTTFPNYPYGKLYDGYNLRDDFQEEIDGVTVIRNKINIHSYGNKVGRMLSYLSFLYYSLRNSKKLTGDYDVIVTTIGPIFVSLIGYHLSRRLKIPNILEFRDITYKQMQATRFGNRLAIYLVKKMEIFFAQKADCVVTVTDSYIRILNENGIKGPLRCIPNGFLPQSPVSKNSEDSAETNHIRSIIKNEKNKGRQVLGYFGVIGVSQNLSELVINFKKNNQYSLVIVGSGSKSKEINELIKDNHLDNVFIFPAIEEKHIRDLYIEVDYNLIKLENSDEFGATIPSKLFQILGNGGLPIFIGPIGEVTKILDQISNKLYMTDYSQLFIKLDQFTKSTNNIHGLRVKGQQIILENFNRVNHANKYLEIINDVKR